MKLNIGSGPVQIPGFENIDRVLGTEAYPLTQFSDNSVDEIRASHVLEHFSYADVQKVLNEWVRVLKPGGRIRIAVPDMYKAIQLPGEQKYFALMGGQTDKNDFHYAAFDEERLSAHMNNAGLTDIKPWQTDGLDTSSHPCSLNLEGVKPIQKEKSVSVKIKAVMSIPRLGFNDTWGCVHDVLAAFKIPVASYMGAFWGQCMQKAMVEAIEQDVDWVLTLDYDSLFTAKQLQFMMQAMASNPDIGALAPLQMKRGSAVPLHTIEGQTRMEINSDAPVEVSTAHFGLTLIRTEAIKKMPKPWFQCVPGPSGDYDDDRLDGDIYFWKKFREAGNKVFVAPTVSIGHLETLVAWFDENCDPQYITPKAWREKMLK